MAVLLAGSRVAWAGPPSSPPPNWPEVTPQPRAPQAIVGGQATATCGWPSVVALQTGGLCTATLVHPRVIVYAAHCGTLHGEALFGERVDTPAREVPILACERFTDVFAVSSMDYAYCLLAEPVEDIAITPPLFGCDEDLIQIGTPVTIVGFGDTTSEDPPSVGIKHEATTQIVNMLSTVMIGGMGVGADSGDSGGPAFVQLDDGSWRMLGLVSGGGGDGGTVQYVPAPVTIAWIEDRSGVDITPCHDADGNWAPTPACEGFYIATEPGASWAAGCPSERSGPSDRCGPPWTELVDVEPPSVAFIEPLDGDVLPGPPIVFGVLAEADDGGGVGVAQLRLRIDGEPWPLVDEVPPYRFDGVEIDIAGTHLLELEAIDAFGNLASVGANIVVGEVGDDESGTDESGGESGDDADTGTSSGSDDGATAPGCACTLDAQQRPAIWALLPLLALGLRPRQRATNTLRARSRAWTLTPARARRAARARHPSTSRRSRPGRRA